MRAFFRLVAGAAGVSAAALGGVALGTAMLAFFIGTPRRIFNPRKSPARRGAACEDVALSPRGGGPRLLLTKPSSPTIPPSSSGASRNSRDGCKPAVSTC